MPRLPPETSGPKGSALLRASPRHLRLGLLLGLLGAAACGPTPDPAAADLEEGPPAARAPAGDTVTGTPGSETPAPAATGGGTLLPPADPLAALAECPAPIASAFREDPAELPGRGSERYRLPTAADLEALRSSFVSFLGGNAAGARASAALAGYTLCRGRGDESSIVFWEPPPGEGQALVALRVGPARPVILEAPHPFYDGGTVPGSALLFRRLGARALITAGTHRCANAATSGCDGTTTACGGDGAFRVSDMAHTDESTYHVAHVALSEHFQDDWVLGMHGMGASGVSVSDGTQLPTTSVSPAARIAVALAREFTGVTTCNAFGSFPRRNHMCGTTDVQGRHLNGPGAACTADTRQTSGRFIHLEQSGEVRGQPERVAAALEGVLPR